MHLLFGRKRARTRSNAGGADEGTHGDDATDETQRRQDSGSAEPKNQNLAATTSQLPSESDKESDTSLFVEDSYDLSAVAGADEVHVHSVAAAVHVPRETSTQLQPPESPTPPTRSVPGTPHRSKAFNARRSPLTSPQRQRAGFSEPQRHPTRQPPYKRPRFKTSNPGLTGQPPPPSPARASAVARQRQTTADKDMDEGAAGVSSDFSSDGSPVVPSPRPAPSAPERLVESPRVEPAPLAPLQQSSRDEALSVFDDGMDVDESIVPDSQPSTTVSAARLPGASTADPKLPGANRRNTSGAQTFAPKTFSADSALNSVLNTTTDSFIGLSPPSVLTAGSQGLSQSTSREKLTHWLQYQQDCRPYSMLDFLKKYLKPSIDPRTKLGKAFAGYVVGHGTEIDSPLKMQGRHKDLGWDDTSSSEKFFHRLLYEMRSQQKNMLVESEILYGPWSELASLIGRPLVVFLLLYTRVYKPVGESQWLQISGEVPRYQAIRSASMLQHDSPTRFVTKRDVVFREFGHFQSVRLPPLSPAMHRLFPPHLKRLIDLVEKRVRPMRFLFKLIGVNNEGWTSRQKVAKFLMLCVKKIFPRAILGSPANDKALAMTVRRFVNMSATARMPLGQAAHGVKLKDIPWAEELPKDPTKMREVILLFWEWAFDHFLKPMLAQHFFMTEMSGDAASLYYYELSVWVRKVKAAGTSAFVEQHGGKDQLCAGDDGERMRFIPKRTGGVRPIVNLKEFNKSLKLAHVVLQSLPRSHTRLENWHSWYLRVQAFKSSHELAANAKYYVVKLDVSGCYDNMKKQKLEEVVRKHLSNGEREFWLQTHSVLDSRTNLIKDRSSAVPAEKLYAAASTDESLLPVQDFRRPQQPALVYFSKSKGILPAQGTRLPPERLMLHGSPYSGDEVLDDLKRLIHELKIQVKASKTLPFNTGIPQGSSCSLDLCNLLLDDLVHTKLGAFVDDPRCLLLRYVDDFLFVSTSRKMAQSYQAIMLRGFAEEYGVTCKKEKQQSNLRGPRARMEYLGYEFDPNTLDIYPRKLNLRASTAPLPVHKAMSVRRMHFQLESLLGLLRVHQRAGMEAPVILEKRVSRAFGKFVVDSFEACSEFASVADPKKVFQKLARMKLLPLVSAQRRTSILKTAENMFLIWIQRRARLPAQDKKASATPASV